MIIPIILPTRIGEPSGEVWLNDGSLIALGIALLAIVVALLLGLFHK